MVVRDQQPSRPMDAAVGLAALAAQATLFTTRRVVRAAMPLARVLLDPPLLSTRLHPSRVVDALAERGRSVMTSAYNDVDRLAAMIVPAVVREALDLLDLNALIRERIDLVELVASIDLTELLDRIDVDTIVRQVDIDAIVQRIDLDAVVQRIDVNAVAERIDLDAVTERIDLDRIVARIDVVGLVEQVLNEIDLPEIIRESTGSLASQAVRDVRTQSIVADEVLSRVADRLLRRRQGRRTDVWGHSPAVGLIAEDGSKT